MDLAAKTDAEINNWISNHEAKRATGQPLYRQLLEERARRTQSKHQLNFDQSLAHLKEAAIHQRCTTYGELAKASGVDWKVARHQMNGPSGHLDRLLDICFARHLPLLTAICVNQNGVATGELEQTALSGFASGARRLGISVTDERKFHHDCRSACWEWGRLQKMS